MEGTMKAMVLEGPGRLVYQQVPIPKIGPRDILFKISYAAVCGGDLPAYRDLHYLQHTPIIIGHEFTGYVVALAAMMLMAADLEAPSAFPWEPLTMTS